MRTRVSRYRQTTSWLLDRIRLSENAARLSAQGFDRARVETTETMIICGDCSSALGLVDFADVQRFPLHPRRDSGCQGQVRLKGAWREPNIPERVFAYMWQRRYEPLWAETMLLLTIVAIAVLLLPVYILAWLAAVPALWVQFPEARTEPSARAAATIILLLIAGLLYWVRRTNRATYGVGEVVIGGILCWSTMNDKEPGDLSTALKLGAAVYIVVRGLDNSYEGFGQRTFWHVLGSYGYRMYKRSIDIAFARSLSS